MKKRTIIGLAVIAAAVATMFAAPTVASAHDNKITATCTSLSASLTNYPAGSTIGATLDGVDLGTTTFGPSYSDSVALDPGVAHSWTIRVTSGDGDKRYNFTETGISDPKCIPVVTPPVVVDVLQPHIQDYIDCLGGRFVLDNTGSTVAVTYTVQGSPIAVPAGQAIHTDADGTLYQPLDGTYTVAAGDKVWTFPTAGNCPIDQPTDPNPPVTDTPEVPTSPATPTGPTPSTPPTPTVTETPTSPTVPPNAAPVTPSTDQNVASSQRIAQTCQQSGPNVKATDRNLDADGDGIGCETRGVAPVPTPIRTEAKFTG